MRKTSFFAFYHCHFYCLHFSLHCMCCTELQRSYFFLPFTECPSCTSSSFIILQFILISSLREHDVANPQGFWRVGIFSSRDILEGEELAYDYKFESFSTNMVEEENVLQPFFCALTRLIFPDPLIFLIFSAVPPPLFHEASAALAK